MEEKCNHYFYPQTRQKNNLPKNYRLIALYSLSKFYQRITLTYLKNDLNTKISPEKFVFRPEHSTTPLLTKFTHLLSENHKNDIQSASVFLEVKKAFDCVWLEGLFYKLIAIDTLITIVKIIKSFLTDQVFQTKIDYHLATFRQILSRVLQVSCLSLTPPNLCQKHSQCSTCSVRRRYSVLDTKQ